MYRFKRFDENGELLYLFLPPLSVTQPFVMFNLKELRVDNEGSRSVCLSVLQLCLSDSAFNLCVWWKVCIVDFIDIRKEISMENMLCIVDFIDIRKETIN